MFTPWSLRFFNLFYFVFSRRLFHSTCHFAKVWLWLLWMWRCCCCSTILLAWLLFFNWGMMVFLATSKFWFYQRPLEATVEAVSVFDNFIGVTPMLWRNNIYALWLSMFPFAKLKNNINYNNTFIETYWMKNSSIVFLFYDDMIHINTNVYCMLHIIMLYYVYVLVAAGHNQLVSSAITSSKIIVIVLVYWFPLFRERKKCHVFWGGKPLIMIIITATESPIWMALN